jgi:hypothetical protein
VRGEDASRLFPPKHATAESARQSILLILRRSPETLGWEQSRWTLSTLLAQCDWLNLTTVGGLSLLLRQFKISYKRGREYVHSPDPFYVEKLNQIEQCRLQAWYAPGRYALLYQDELTYYRQPTLNKAYEVMGPVQPLAQRSHRANTAFRITAALDAVSGRVLYRQRSHINRSQFVAFLADVAAAYTTVQTIYLVVDNWPVHFHPDVLVCLEQQRHLLWPLHIPDNWPKTSTHTPKYTNLPIQLLPLPTYASWLNPIEKLWRWLKQDILHLHRYSSRWDELKQRIARWLDAFRHGSEPLLHYVGLLPN